MFRAGEFASHIYHIRFPHYRNLVENARVEFRYPVTALVGPNGSGKTSVLQALYGAPDGYSVGRFWFATSVDPIDEAGGRPALIYGYRPAGGQQQLREVVKTRIVKKQRGDYDPDYWEPSRPLKRYDMLEPPDGLERTPAIRRAVVYINFRHYVPAFERCYYEVVPPDGRTRDYLRAKSNHLSLALKRTTPVTVKGRDQNRLPERVTAEVVKDVAAILRKSYDHATWIEHRMFGRKWGDTAVFASETSSYSNAFAGSGEIAALYLVRKVHDAPKNSLVLLDEPEISLHPSAQREVVNFLLRMAKAKSLQVVYTTHAPAMIEGLPTEAISVFVERGSKYSVENGVHPNTALDVLGQPVDRPKLIVEDALAKKMVERALSAASPALDKAFDVEHQPGGAKDILRNCVVYARTPAKYAVVLDADQAPSPEAWATSATPTVRELDEVIGRVAGFVPKFAIDGGSQGGDPHQAIAARTEFLRFLRYRVRYLPGLPEDMVWQHASRLAPIVTPDAVAAINGNAKERLLALANETGLGVPTLCDLLARAWALSRNVDFEQVVQDLQQLARYGEA